MSAPDPAALDPEDIVNGTSDHTLRLEQEAEAILSDATDRPAPIRQAVREDAAEARAWARRRAERAQEAIRDEPLRATLYALGIGVLIGLLAAR